MINLIKKSITVAAACVMALQVGCASSPSDQFLGKSLAQINKAPRNVNLVYCPSVASSPDVCHVSLVSEMCCANVSMFVLGQTLRIVLPKREFFDVSNLSEVKLARIPMLRRLASLLTTSYHGAPIKIIGYTNDIASPRQRLAQSQQMAGAIAAYLWNYGVSPATVKVVAGGASDPVAVNDTLMGRNYNQRVEIQVGLPQS